MCKQLHMMWLHYNVSHICTKRTNVPTKEYSLSDALAFFDFKKAFDSKRMTKYLWKLKARINM